MTATILQIVGLVSVVAGAVVTAGAGGALIAGGIAVVFVGIAAEKPIL